MKAKQVQARKDWNCEKCGKTIPEGMSHMKSKGRYHNECVRFISGRHPEFEVEINNPKSI